MQERLLHHAGTRRHDARVDFAHDGAFFARDLRIAPVRDTTDAKRVEIKLPDERQSLTHKFSIQGHEGYVTAGLYDDGQPGEVFIRIAKEGSTIGGLMDTIATLVSVSLQYGVPVESLVRKFEHVRFEHDVPRARPRPRAAWRGWRASRRRPRARAGSRAEAAQKPEHGTQLTARGIGRVA